MLYIAYFVHLFQPLTIIIFENIAIYEHEIHTFGIGNWVTFYFERPQFMEINFTGFVFTYNGITRDK